MSNAASGYRPSLLECPPFDEPPTHAHAVTPESLIRVLELTTLNGDDDEARVERLCERAVRPSLQKSLPPTAAVCIYPVFISAARAALTRLQPNQVGIATVAGGFPHGLSPLGSRIQDASLAAHADDVDVVIRRELANCGRWEEQYAEIESLRSAVGPKKMKVILSVGELLNPEVIFRASMVALMAGADFIKTSTGKDRVGPTLEHAVPMISALRRYGERTGVTAGFKAAGGIATFTDAASWHRAIYHGLGEEACTPERFRIGASSLLDDLVACAH